MKCAVGLQESDGTFSLSRDIRWQTDRVPREKDKNLAAGNYFRKILEAERIFSSSGDGQDELVYAESGEGTCLIDCDFDAVRAIVSLLAAAMISPEAATYILGTTNGGRGWIERNVPALLLNDTVTTLNNRPIGEAIGVEDFTIESDSSFELLTLRRGDRYLQTLACHSYIFGFLTGQKGSELGFQTEGVDSVVNRIGSATKSLFASAGFGSMQEPGIWNSFVRVLKSAHCALDLSTSVNVHLVKSQSHTSPVRVAFLGPGPESAFRAFTVIAALAYGRYRPERLLQRPSHFTPGLAKWFRSEIFTPAVVIDSGQISSRECLVARGEIDGWLRAGCMSLDEVASLAQAREDVSDMADRSHFVRNHKRSGFCFAGD